LDELGGIPYLNVADLLTEPIACTLLINPAGKMEVVATSHVFPKQNELYSLPVQDGYAIVHVDFVYPEHEGIVLNPPPSGEITILGEALFKRIEWSRGCIVVSPKVLSSQRSPRPPLHGHGSAKSNLKDLVVANASSSQDGKAKSATVEDKKPTKSSRATMTPSSAPRKAKSDTEQ